MPVVLKKKVAHESQGTSSKPDGFDTQPVVTIDPADVVERRPLSALIPYARNARTHSTKQIKEIAKSMQSWGWTIPVLIDEEDMIIAGHGRVLAAQSLGKQDAPVLVARGWSEAQKRAYVLADNKLAMNAGWDNALLSSELAAIRDLDFDVTLTGFSLSDVAGILQAGGLTDDDAVPDIPPKVISKPGDIWVCGDHRVMCGSSTTHQDVTLLMQGEKASMVWTDPPYLMNYTHSMGDNGVKHNKSSGIKNDNLSKEDGEKFLLSFTSQLRSWCHGAWYITFYRLGIDWMFKALQSNNLKYRNLIIWAKNNHNLSNSDYKSLYEPMIVGWADDYVPIFYGWEGMHPWYGPKSEFDIWEVELPSVWAIDKTKKNELHPTMKPVELVARAVHNSSMVGDTVLDFFGGSGTTLIACEKLGRKARIMELDPKYVDVIVTRWQEYTGKTAYLESTGNAFPTT